MHGLDRARHSRHRARSVSARSSAFRSARRRVLLPHRSGNLVTLARLGIPISSRSLRSSGLRCIGLSLAPEAGWVGLRGNERSPETSCGSSARRRVLLTAVASVPVTIVRDRPPAVETDVVQSALPLAVSGRHRFDPSPCGSLRQKKRAIRAAIQRFTMPSRSTLPAGTAGEAESPASKPARRATSQEASGTSSPHPSRSCQAFSSAQRSAAAASAACRPRYALDVLQARQCRAP
jgi:hypothetical protein